jgi:acetyltransferase-like isoleucine patch superfamily enzyme
LGKRVRCGANTVITDTDWHTDDPRTSPPEAVVIEDDAWLDLNVVVLKGVTIGKGSLIGANSLVSRSIPAGAVAAGAPAKVIRNLKGADQVTKSL